LNPNTIAGIGDIALGVIGVVALVVIYAQSRRNERLVTRLVRAQDDANRWRDIASGHVRPARPVPNPTVTGEILPQPIRGHRQ